MNERSMILAIPSAGEGGLDAERSGHFGRCDCFTLVDIADGVATGVRVVDNPAHTEGGCLRPVELLASHGVTALVVAGIGGRPLAGFNQEGIGVYYDAGLPSVGQVVDAMLAGTIDAIGPDTVCGCH